HAFHRARHSFPTRRSSDLRLEEVDPADYDAVFYPGGHGPMEDLAADAASGVLLVRTLESGRPLGVVCHGPAALLAAVRPDGSNADRKSTRLNSSHVKISYA